jgi:4-hydroxy-3-polyprenylbenzoate decarboxylase
MERTGLVSEKRLTVAVTGASGSIYAKRFLEAAVRHFDRIYLTASGNASNIMQDELGAKSLQDIIPSGARVEVFDPSDVYAPPSSGSHRQEGMVVIPCSMGTLGRVAAGISNDLITRSADVCLKERRKLVLVVRETPLSLIHLQNMTSVTQAGGVILPASPAFYHKPLTITEMVDFVVMRILQQFGIDEKLVPQWKEV